MRIEFDLAGAPVAKGRARITTRGGFARAYTPEKTRKAEESLIARAIRFAPAEPLAGPLAVALTFVFAVPESWSRKKREAALRCELHHTTKPDVDNVVKSTLDALQGVFFLDDKQIVQLEVRKSYGAVPMTRVTIEELTRAVASA